MAFPVAGLSPVVAELQARVPSRLDSSQASLLPDPIHQESLNLRSVGGTVEILEIKTLGIESNRRVVLDKQHPHQRTLKRCLIP